MGAIEELARRTAGTGLTWRPLGLEDVPVWHRLVEAATAADHGAEHLTADDLRDEFAPWVDAARDTVVALDPDGAARAFGMVQVRPGDVTLLRATCWGTVDPTWRRRGVGRALLDWQLDRARGLVASRREELGPDVPAQAHVRIDVDHVPGAPPLLEQAGLAVHRWFCVMRRDLAEPLPAVRLDDGLRLAPYEDALDEPLRLAHNEAFAQHWGFQPWSRQTWEQWSTGHRSFRPGWTFAVLDGDEVAAYTICAGYESDWAAQGYTEGWTAKLGVRAPWRGRGLAKALLARSMHAFAADGMQYAGLDVDSENPTGAVQLYTGLGYGVHRREANYVLTL